MHPSARLTYKSDRHGYPLRPDAAISTDSAPPNALPQRNHAQLMHMQPQHQQHQQHQPRSALAAQRDQEVKELIGEYCRV
jgi:hypothetical protein